MCVFDSFELSERIRRHAYNSDFGVPYPILIPQLFNLSDVILRWITQNLGYIPLVDYGIHRLPEGLEVDGF